ncbi:hypothetical protein HGRIS_001195 [Hohenbuehelia grisea]|uniref:EF-hand domain-containing protein n=1 Tax=Hohenbuehelia grisea TaxID=104357 RepID=A0ABR3JNK5_9AGAR
MQTGNAERRFAVAERRAEDAERAVSEAQEAATNLETQNNALTPRVTELESIILALKHKTLTLYDRSKEGRLDNDEKAFVETLLDISRSAHEQVLVAKDNELRRVINSWMQPSSDVSDSASKDSRELTIDKGKSSVSAFKAIVSVSDPKSEAPVTPPRTFRQIDESDLSEEIESDSDHDDYVPLMKKATAGVNQGVKRRRVTTAVVAISKPGPSNPVPKTQGT